MADVSTGVSAAGNTIQQLVSAQVQEVLNANLVAAGAVQDLSSLVGPGQDTVKIPKMGKFTVNTKSAGTAVNAQTNAFGTDDLALSQYKVIQFLVEDIAQLESKVAITQAYVKQAAIDIATEMDAKIITDMAAGASSSAPDHRIAWDNALALLKQDFLNARRLLNIQNVPMNERSCIISPSEEASVLSIDSFVKVNESGGDSALRNGQIGRLFGFDVMVSSQAADAASLFFHKTAHSFARQLMPKVEYFRDVPNLSDRWSISHIYGSKHMDSGKRCVLVGSAT